jgi:hypothetical protein
VIDALLEANSNLETERLYTLENVSQSQFDLGVSYQELLMINYDSISQSEK